jgi:hypothetical protein
LKYKLFLIIIPNWHLLKWSSTVPLLPQEVAIVVCFVVPVPVEVVVAVVAPAGTS